MWESLEADGGALLDSEWEQYRYESLFPKADVHKILSLLRVVVLIRGTTRVYAARCEMCIEVGFSSSLPSSVPQEIVLSLATVWLHYVPQLPFVTLVSFHCLVRAAESKHLRWCECKNFLMYPCQRVTKKFLASFNISNMAGHAA